MAKKRDCTRLVSIKYYEDLTLTGKKIKNILQLLQLIFEEKRRALQDYVLKEWEMRKQVVSTILLAGVSFGAQAARHNYRDYNSEFRDALNNPEFIKIDICKPFKDGQEQVEGQIRQLQNSRIPRQMAEIETKIANKSREINALKSAQNVTKSNIENMSARLRNLEENMDSMLASVQAQVDKFTQEEIKAREKKEYAARQKDEASIIFKPKWELRRMKYKKEEDEAKEKKEAQQRILINLPKERDQLPNQIAAQRAELQKINQKLMTITSASPTLSDLQQSLASLQAQNRDITRQVQDLQRDLKYSVLAYTKCRYMEEVTNAYPLMLKQAETFKQKPETCDNIDSLMYYIDKKFEQRAMEDAHKLICDGDLFSPVDPEPVVCPNPEPVQCPQVPSCPGDDDPSYPNRPVERVVDFNQVIESPMASDGEYESDFRTDNREAISIGKVDVPNTTKIRFAFDYDIEKPSSSGRIYDYVLIVDADGKEIAKLAGNGTFESGWIETSSVEFFFYSDGRGEGEGFAVKDIQLTILE